MMNPLTNISNQQFISQKRMNLFKKKYNLKREKSKCIKKIKCLFVTENSDSDLKTNFLTGFPFLLAHGLGIILANVLALG